MKTWFTADPHFAHERIFDITNRVFADQEEHNNYLIDAINSRVGEKDRLFILGDFAWYGAKQWYDRIICKSKHLIIGNHDPAKTARLFVTAEDTCIVKVGEHKIFCSHYPHAFWPSSHRGSLHIYGHVHSEREEFLDTVFPGRRSMDVGVDNAKRILGDFRPFEDIEIVDLLMARPGHDQVEWYEEQRKLRGEKLYVPVCTGMYGSDPAHC